jgi:hypothetical protein
MLRDDEWEVLDAGQEYEAKNTLPLFWLCMFSEADITLTQDEVFDGQAVLAYPYLLADQAVVTMNMKERRPVIACLDPARLALYDSFTSRVSTATHPYWLLRTREIVGMTDAKAFAQELMRTFDGLEEYQEALKKNDAARLRDSWFAKYLADVKQTHSSYMLSGASTDSSWLPNEIELPKLDEAEEVAPTAAKKWWQFWK